jgi:hypothetical protein
MQLMVFVTDDDVSAEGTGPLLIVEERPNAVLPPHPRSLAWKYFATVALEDTLLEGDRAAIEAAVVTRRSHISPRLIFVPIE